MLYAIVSEYGKYYFNHKNQNSELTETQLKSIFGECLEELLGDNEMQVSFPHKWLFVSGESKKTIQAGEYKVLKTFSGDDKDSLWELMQWIKGMCCAVPCIVADY